MEQPEVFTVTAHGESWKMLDPGGRIGEHLRVGRPYENKLLGHIRARGFTGSVIDVGAHVGNHSVYLAKLCRLKVYAFEPRPKSYQMLCQNISMNELGAHVYAYPLGVGANATKAHFADAGTMNLDLDGGEVKVVAIDDFLGVSANDVTMVKIDVEGMEPDVMLGMRSLLANVRPTVYAEAHDYRAVKNQRFIMGRLGYRVAGEIKMGSRMLRWEPE